MLYLNSARVFHLLTASLNLTLTSVVFELNKPRTQLTEHYNLTLTSVVFEYGRHSEFLGRARNLTLTSVVFELTLRHYKVVDTLKFNFNKCCI